MLHSFEKNAKERCVLLKRKFAQPCPDLNRRVNCYLTQVTSYMLRNHPDLNRGVNCYLTQVAGYMLRNHPDLYRGSTAT